MDYTNPETVNHQTRYKRKRRDETAFFNIGKSGHPYLGTTSRVSDNRAFIRGVAAKLDLSKPKAKWRPTPASFRLLSESLLICQVTGTSDAMFIILVSDVRLAGHTDKERVWEYVAYLGRSRADFERAWANKPRMYSAQERATAHGLGYEQFCRLELRSSGCLDKTPQERLSMSRERWNAKRRQPGARTAEYGRRTERRRAETKIKRHAEAQIKTSSDGVSNVKSLGAVTVTRVTAKLEDRNVCKRAKMNESDKSGPKINQIDLEKRRKPPETMPNERQDSEQIPFLERAELMMLHCGLSRAEAEAEARAWDG